MRHSVQRTVASVYVCSYVRTCMFLKLIHIRHSVQRTVASFCLPGLAFASSPLLECLIKSLIVLLSLFLSALLSLL